MQSPEEGKVSNHIARWPWKIQVLQPPSFQCKVWIGWWEGGAGGAGSAHWPMPWKHLHCDEGCIFEAIHCYQEQGLKCPLHRTPILFYPLCSLRRNCKRTTTSVAKPFCAYLEWNKASHTHLFKERPGDLLAHQDESYFARWRREEKAKLLLIKYKICEVCSRKLSPPIAESQSNVSSKNLME